MIIVCDSKGLSGTPIEIEGKEYISPTAYPTFAFRYDEETKKYSIANTEKKRATKAFVDEIMYSRVPLRSWTEDYVVVRIGWKYYLADNDGNCFLEKRKSFIICRNVFLLMEDSHVCVVKGLREKGCNYERGESYTFSVFGDYQLAFIKRQSPKGDYLILINSLGDNVAVLDNSSPSYAEDSKKIYQGNVIPIEDKEKDAHVKTFAFIDDNSNIFVKWSDRFGNIELIGPQSFTYRRVGKHNEWYSSYFNSYVKFEKHDDLEVIWHNSKTYFLKFSGEVEEIDGIIVGLKVEGKFLVYRIENKIVFRDIDGTYKEETLLTPKEVYDYIISGN